MISGEQCHFAFLQWVRMFGSLVFSAEILAARRRRSLRGAVHVAPLQRRPVRPQLQKDTRHGRHPQREASPTPSPKRRRYPGPSRFCFPQFSNRISLSFFFSPSFHVLFQAMEQKTTPTTTTTTTTTNGVDSELSRLVRSVKAKTAKQRPHRK